MFRELLKSILLCHQKTVKKQSGSSKISFKSPMQLYSMCLNPLLQYLCPLILLPPLFERISQPPDQDQQYGKGTCCVEYIMEHSVDYHPGPLG